MHTTEASHMIHTLQSLSRFEHSIGRNVFRMTVNDTVYVWILFEYFRMYISLRVLFLCAINRRLICNEILADTLRSGHDGTSKDR